MASRWQRMGTSMHWRSLQHQEQLEDSKELQPVDNSMGALGSLCRQFQRRLPLRAINLNFCAGLSWKCLETPEPGQQGFQAIAHSAKSAMGAMSQRIQESCQSGTKWLVEIQVKPRRRKRGAQKGSGSPTHSLSQKSTQLSGDAPGHSATDLWEKEHHDLSAQIGSHPLCSPSQSDSDLEPMGVGIQHFQKLSQKLDEAIMAEESGADILSLIHG
uniref:PICALM interacting mitotic regulator n=1 Tax=Colobus angolensis palliatus TaxID=336983 RepID=A0A2K5IGJ4_COLAP